MSTFKNLVGQKFGLLTVTERAANTLQNKSTWHTSCECGSSMIVRATYLKNGAVRSCGCLIKIAAVLRGKIKVTSRPRGFSALKELYSRYKRTARIANREFDIGMSMFTFIVTSNCHYCGRPPSNSVFSGKREKYNEGINFSGIDRKDNDKGYVLSNCVSCCIICNHAKHTMSYDEFMQYLDDLVKFRTK